MRRVTGRRFVFGAGAAGVALLVLAGCSSYGYAAYGGTVTKADVIGHWTSNCGASIDVSPGGTASASAFPTAWDQSGKPTKTFNGAGVWGLYNAPSGGGDSGIQVNFGNVVNTLYYASVKGKLGFAYDEPYNDATGQDDEYCIFSRS